MSNNAPAPREPLREALRRNFAHAQGRPPSEEELGELIAAERAAADYVYQSRARDRFGDRPSCKPSDAPTQPVLSVDAPMEPSAALTPEDWQDALRAFRDAKAHGMASLSAVIVLMVQCRGTAISVPAAVAEFNMAKRCQGNREAILRTYRVHLGAFAGVFRQTPLASVTPKQIADYLLRWENSATRASRWQYLATFFAWAVRHGYRDVNPVFLAMRKPLRPQAERCIFTPSETREILRRTKDTPAVGHWALALFAGLRMHELIWLHDQVDPWSLVRSDTGVIDLREQPLKFGPRVVPILPVLRPWLEWIRKRDAPFLSPNHQRARRRLKHEVLAGRFGRSVFAGRRDAVPFYDMERRTCITYWLALPGASYADVSHAVGNSERTLRRFYAQRASRGDARQYFSLTPDRV